jgi:hypothetical protein
MHRLENVNLLLVYINQKQSKGAALFISPSQFFFVRLKQLTLTPLIRLFVGVFGRNANFCADGGSFI